MNKFNIDQTHLDVLTHIYHNPYISFSDLSAQLAEYPNIEEIIVNLEANHLISFRIASSSSTDEGYEHSYVEQSSHLVTLTNGNALVEKEVRHAKELESQLKPLLTIAEKTSSLAESASIQAKSALEQADLAKKQAEKADDASHKAKRQSQISNFIAVIAVIIAVLAWLVPRELVLQFLLSLFS